MSASSHAIMASLINRRLRRYIKGSRIDFTINYYMRPFIRISVRLYYLLPSLRFTAHSLTTAYMSYCKYEDGENTLIAWIWGWIRGIVLDGASLRVHIVFCRIMVQCMAFNAFGIMPYCSEFCNGLRINYIEYGIRTESL